MGCSSSVNSVKRNTKSTDEVPMQAELKKDAKKDSENAIKPATNMNTNVEAKVKVVQTNSTIVQTHPIPKPEATTNELKKNTVSDTPKPTAGNPVSNINPKVSVPTNSTIVQAQAVPKQEVIPNKPKQNPLSETPKPTTVNPVSDINPKVSVPTNPSIVQSNSGSKQIVPVQSEVKKNSATVKVSTSFDSKKAQTLSEKSSLLKNYYKKRFKELEIVKLDAKAQFPKPKDLNFMDLEFFLGNKDDIEGANHDIVYRMGFFDGRFYKYFEFEKLMEWLKSQVTQPGDFIELNFAENFPDYVFKYGQSMNEMVSGQLITQQPQNFLTRLGKFSDKFRFWIEEDSETKIPSIYIYNLAKRYKDRILALKLEVLTPNQDFYDNTIKRHNFKHELDKANENKALEVYTKFNLKPDDIYSFNGKQALVIRHA